MRAHRVLCCVLLAALGLPDRPAVAWGLVAYHPPTLITQQANCSPQGPDPWQGCDQCLSRIYRPLVPLLNIFCGRLDQDWCSLGRDCTHCNGACTVIWNDGNLAYVSVLQPMGTVQTAIDLCRQWQTQTYCTTAGGTPVSGAYVLADEFEWLPLHQQDYRSLPTDPDYQWALDTYHGEPAFGLEEAWRHRIGIFGLLATRNLGGRRLYWERAANLVAWYYIALFAEPSELAEVLAQNQFPDRLRGQEFDDLVDIFETTCGATPFLDCWHPVAADTWGGIKGRYRSAE
ncbi:MAG TPA: hypothetical protein VNM87_02645 [Candidatus Udaeobacter sp.]|nr:hypothetical protein [Candidatus Udaeobacter sp.]